MSHCLRRRRLALLAASLSGVALSWSPRPPLLARRRATTAAAWFTTTTTTGPPLGRPCATAATDATYLDADADDTAGVIPNAHKGTVLSLGVDGHGDLLSGGHDRTVRRWELLGDGSLQPRSLVRESGSVFSVAAGHGGLVATGCFDRAARVYHRAGGSGDGDGGSDVELQGEVGDHTGWVRAILLLPPGDGGGAVRLASIGCNYVRLSRANEEGTGWRCYRNLDSGASEADLASGEPWRRHDVLSIARGPTSGVLFAGLVDGSLRGWSPTALEPAASAGADTDADADASVSASAGADAHLDAEFVVDGFQPAVSVADAHGGRVTHLVATARTRARQELLISAGLDGCVHVWRCVQSAGGGCVLRGV